MKGFALPRSQSTLLRAFCPFQEFGKQFEDARTVCYRVEENIAYRCLQVIVRERCAESSNFESFSGSLFCEPLCFAVISAPRVA